MNFTKKNNCNIIKIERRYVMNNIETILKQLKDNIKAYKKYKIPYDIAEDFIKSKKLDFKNDKFLEIKNNIIESFSKNGKPIMEYIDKHNNDKDAIINIEDINFIYYLIGIDKKTDEFYELGITYDPIDPKVIKEVIEEIGNEVAIFLKEIYSQIKEEENNDLLAQSIPFDKTEGQKIVIDKFKSISQEFYNNPNEWIERYKERDAKRKKEITDRIKDEMEDEKLDDE